jgi:sugar-specific transcriptional regulator TrmB
MIDPSVLTQLLKNIGFSEKEATVYLTLLELNEALPAGIARKTGLKRPTTYLVLEELQKRGIVSSVKKSGVLYYQASKPEVFLEKERQRMGNVNKTLETLSTALPELQSLHQQYAATPQMSVYYGKEGLIQIMEDSLEAKTELLCWVNSDMALHSILSDYYPTYIRKKVKNKLWLRGIFGYDKTALLFKKNGKKELREVYLVPKDKFYFDNEINIYDDKISIISHEDEMGVIIQNEHIANTQRAIFNLAFEHAKELEMQILTKDDIDYLSSSLSKK